MKIRYLIDGNETHYVEYTLDPKKKTASNAYVKDGTTQTGQTINIAMILDLEPTKNPQVELMKKGKVWDLHLIKINAYGKEVRKSLSIVLQKDVTPTKIVFVNDDTATHTLVNYITHPLEVYRSPLRVAYFDFTDIERITGISDESVTSPLLTPADQLKVGWNANLRLNVAGAGVVDLSSVPTVITFKIDRLGSNIAGLQPQLKFIIGSNVITIGSGLGIEVNGPLEFTSAQVSSAMEIRLEITSTKTTMYVNDVQKVVTFNVASPVDEIHIIGRCDNGQYSLIDEVLVQALENYRVDAIPPAPVKNIDAISGDTEIFLEWSPNTEEDLKGYNVYVNGKRHNLEVIPTPDYQVTGLRNGITVKVVVTAIDKSGNESPSKEIIEMNPISTPLKEVSGVTSYVNTAGVTFNWVSPTYQDLRKIRVYRSNSADNTTHLLAELDASKTTFQDTPRPDAGSYRYTISTFDVNENETSGVSIRKQISAVPTP